MVVNNPRAVVCSGRPIQEARIANQIEAVLGGRCGLPAAWMTWVQAACTGTVQMEQGRVCTHALGGGACSSRWTCWMKILFEGERVHIPIGNK